MIAPNAIEIAATTFQCETTTEYAGWGFALDIKPKIASFKGYCPICEKDVVFSANEVWFRDHLLCSGCHSIPRERALCLVLDEAMGDWRSRRIHESSPTPRGISVKLQQQCSSYIATQFYPGEPLGDMVRGYRNENLEQLTFQDTSFDCFVSLDVMEHVNDAEKVFREAARTLVPGGIAIFTTPTYKAKAVTERRALYRNDGSVDFLGNQPEYHGNPVSNDGSLVTFHFGYDLPDLIKQWSGLDTRVHRFNDFHHGIVAEMTEVYVCRKRED
jgi:SAM-dependent methyltransferase